MNTFQKIIASTAAIGIVVMILFPPTCYTSFLHDTGEVTVFSGYNFIGKMESIGNGRMAPIFNNDLEPRASVYKIEPVRLFFQCRVQVISATARYFRVC